MILKVFVKRIYEEMLSNSFGVFEVFTGEIVDAYDSGINSGKVIIVEVPSEIVSEEAVYLLDGELNVSSRGELMLSARTIIPERLTAGWNSLMTTVISRRGRIVNGFSALSASFDNSYQFEDLLLPELVLWGELADVKIGTEMVVYGRFEVSRYGINFAVKGKKIINQCTELEKYLNEHNDNDM